MGGASVTPPSRRQATVFGEVAELYHRFRPDYPAALFDWIVAVVDRPSPWDVLDIGMGTGKSSRWLLEAGHRVTGVEPDPAMAQVALSEARAPMALEIVNTTLEQWDAPQARFDLAISGQAWHWADPATRFDTVARVLRPGGTLCVFWNRPDLTSSPVHEVITEIYETHASELVSGLVAVRFPGSKAAVTGATPVEEFRISGRFAEPATTSIEFVRTVSTAEHCANLRTQSDHRMLPPDQLEALLEAIAAAIDESGGSYDQRYTAHAYAAQVLAR